MKVNFRIRGVPKSVDRLIHAMGIIVAVLAIAVGLASTSWFRHVLEHRIQASLEGITGGKVEIIRMRFQPLDLKVSAQRLTIHGREGNSEPPLFSASRVVAKINPASLFRFRLLLRSLEWQEANIRVVTYPGGSTNLPGTRTAPERGQALVDLMDLGIRRLTLAHTTLNWNNRRLLFEAAARNVAIQLRLSRDHHYLGTLASSNAVLNWNTRKSPPVTFATTFGLFSHQVQVSALSWQIESLRGQANGSFRWEPHFTADFDFRTNGGLEQAASALGITNVRRGYLYLEGKGTYGEAGLEVRGRGEARQLEMTLPQFRSGPVRLSANYALEGDLLKLTGVTFAGLEGRARGEATLRWRGSSPSLALSGQFDNLSLRALLQSIPKASSVFAVLHPVANLNGKASADWQRRSGLRGQFELQFQAPVQAAPGNLPLNGRAEGSLVLGHEKLLELREAQVSTPHSSLNAQGAFGTPQVSLGVMAVTSDFDEWRPLTRILVETRRPFSVVLRSKVIFSGKVSGTFGHPQIDGHLQAGAFEYAGWPWDGLQADIFGAPNQTRISSGRLKIGSSIVTLDAQASLDHWTLHNDSMVHLNVTARKVPVEGLRAALNLKPSMQGLLTGQFQADGTVGKLSGVGGFAVDKGEFAGVPFDLLSAQVRASGSAWEVNGLKIIEGHGQASGQLRLDPATRTFSARLHGRNFPLDKLHLLHPGEAGPKPAGAVQGLVSFDVEGGGSLDNAQVRSTLDISQFAWRGQSFGNVHGSADWQGDEIKLQIKGGGKAGRVQLGGMIETRNDWPAEVDGEYNDFRLDPWIEEFVGHTMGAQIIAGGSFHLSGPLRQSSRITARGQVQHLEIDFPQIKMVNENPLQVQYADRQFKLGRFRMQGPATNLEVGGSIRFVHPPEIDLTAEGQTAATLLNMVSVKIQATGTSTLKVHLGGTLAQPQMSGAIEIHDVSLGYGDLPFRVNALNGKIRLEGERGSISSLQGKIGGGTVSLSGFVVLQDVLRYRVQAQLSQVRVRFPPEFTSLSDGNLTLAGTSEGGQLSGDVTIRNIFASENLSLIDLLAENNNLLGNVSLGVSLPFTSRISLNVRFSSARPVPLETHNLRLLSDIDTRLQGTLADPVVVGNVYLRSGQAVFRGNRYTLSRGQISMTNPFQTEPVLDLQVQTRIEKYDLTMEISGPLDRIRFSYRSDPPLPTEDILSLLAFGYSKQQEGYAPGTRSSFSSMGASALLSQALSSQVTGRVQRLFGVSRVKLSPYSQELGTLGGPVLTIEQQLSPQLTITYETSTANSLYRVYQFEWTVNPRMSVRGFRDQNGIFGLELKFRKRFK